MRKHERIHTDTRPYSCQYCAKAFTQRDKMVVHTRLHTGERPYVCDVCGKGFCESGNLKKHMRVHGKEPPSVMHQNNKGNCLVVATFSDLISGFYKNGTISKGFNDFFITEQGNPHQTPTVSSPASIFRKEAAIACNLKFTMTTPTTNCSSHSNSTASKTSLTKYNTSSSSICNSSHSNNRCSSSSILTLAINSMATRRLL